MFRYRVVKHSFDGESKVSWIDDGSISLKKYWGRSGGRWTKLKRLIIEHRGNRCQKCGASSVTVDAHEVWEYISAYSAGIEPKEVRQIMKARRDNSRKHDAAVQKRHLAMGKPLPLRSRKRSRALVRALVDIKLLCQKCHGAEHHLSADHYRDFIMETHFSGFDELPNFRTFAAWEAKRRDEAAQTETAGSDIGQVDTAARTGNLPAERDRAARPVRGDRAAPQVLSVTKLGTARRFREARTK